MNELIVRLASRASAISRFPAHSIAGLAGTSLKHGHLAAIMSEGKWDGFFEIHAENYMGAGGPPHDALIRSPPVSYSPSSDRSNWPWIGATSPMLRHRPALFAEQILCSGDAVPIFGKVNS
jgi:hypothetical protein